MSLLKCDHLFKVQILTKKKKKRGEDFPFFLLTKYYSLE